MFLNIKISPFLLNIADVIFEVGIQYLGSKTKSSKKENHILNSIGVNGLQGRSSGSLTQYKPDLTEAKTTAGPEGRALTPISILWVSTYQFIVAYKDNADTNSRPGKQRL
jgi:hypothetical protein